MSSSRPSFFRSLLVLGRVSNLPTVWTNCLAAWWILGPEALNGRFVQILAGASLAYVAGMFLNDVFDVEFDREHRPDRPIPAGAISLTLATWMGGAGLAAGVYLLGAPGGAPAKWSCLLAMAILTYNAFHKQISWSPWIMALCRFFLWMCALVSSPAGSSGVGIWSGIVLASWIIALSYVAKRESDRPAAVAAPALIPLVFPFVLAWLANPSVRAPAILVPATLLAIWTWRSLRWIQAKPVQPGRTVAGMLAGICLLDALAAAPPPSTLPWFVAAFLLSLAAQRFVPAT